MVNQHLKKLDISFGELNEDNTQKIIENWLGISLTKYKDKYATFDYFNVDKKVIVELKSRRNDIKKYETQLIGNNKMVKALKKKEDGFNVYFFWLLTDGLYVYEVNRNHNFKKSYLGNYARNDKSSELCLIPNTYLNKTEPKGENTPIKKLEPFIINF